MNYNKPSGNTGGGLLYFFTLKIPTCKHVFPLSWASVRNFTGMKSELHCDEILISWACVFYALQHIEYQPHTNSRFSPLPRSRLIVKKIPCFNPSVLHGKLKQGIPPKGNRLSRFFLLTLGPDCLIRALPPARGRGNVHTYPWPRRYRPEPVYRYGIWRPPRD